MSLKRQEKSAELFHRTFAHKELGIQKLSSGVDGSVLLSKGIYMDHLYYLDPAFLYKSVFKVAYMQLRGQYLDRKTACTHTHAQIHPRTKQIPATQLKDLES